MAEVLPIHSPRRLKDRSPANISSRRSQPQHFVSLPPVKKQKLHHNSRIAQAKLEHIVKPARLGQYDSWGSSSDLSGTKWFDHANQNVTQTMHQQQRGDDSEQHL